MQSLLARNARANRFQELTIASLPVRNANGATIPRRTITNARHDWYFNNRWQDSVTTERAAMLVRPARVAQDGFQSQ